MRAWALIAGAAAFGCALAADEPATGTVEMTGRMGSRDALLVLHASLRADGGWRVAGEYLLLPTLARRFLEGERSPEIGVTTLKEGTTPILFGRAPTGELRGVWRDGQFRGTRYGPGGQEREQFAFGEEFPSMAGYSAQVDCEAGDERYRSSLSFTVESGMLKSFAWNSRVEPAGHACAVRASEQQPMRGGLRFASGRCRISLRGLGDSVKIAAEDCAAACGSQAWLEPLLVDPRGNCRLLRAEAR